MTISRKGGTGHRLPRRWLSIRTLAAALAMLGFLAGSRKVHADSYQHAMPCTVSAVSITVPDVTITDPSMPVGSLLGSPGTATANFNCPNSGHGNPWQYYRIGSSAGRITELNIYSWPGVTSYPNITIQDLPIGNPTYDSNYSGLLYPTNLSGISLLLTASPLPIATNTSGNALVTISQGTTTTQVHFQAQLEKTGSTPGTGTVNSFQLMTFENYSSGYTVSTPAYGSLTVNNVKVATGGCSVAIDPTVVTLPVVLASAFIGKGTTIGQKPFNVQLSCQAGSKLSITLATSNPQAGTTGVIAPTTGSGYAQNVGVQLLKSDGATPVSFGTAISEGTTTNGVMNLPFYAQYYQTGASASAGNVTATATYTLTYQ